MENKKKKKIKVNKKASLFLLKDTILIYMTGVLGASVAVGLPNAVHELENDVHSIVCEIDNDTLSNISYNLTTAIRLDASKPEFIDELQRCKNLRSIEILNAQNLNNKSIEVINEKDLKEIHLIFNRDIVLRKINDHHISTNKFDLSLFTNRSSIKTVKFSEKDNKEINGVIFLNYLLNYEDLDLGLEKYKYLDDILNNIVNSLNLSTWPEDMMNLIKLANFEINYLEYDPEVLEYVATHDDRKADKEMYNLLKRYNDESLSLILDTDKVSVLDYTRQIKGICANFQDLFLMLCIKSGIECYPIDGFYSDELGKDSHGWNLIKLQGSYYFMDLTYFDSFDDLNALMDRFMKSIDPEDYKLLSNNLLIPINSEQAKHYITDKSITEVMLGVINEPEYKNIYGTDINDGLFKLVGLSTVLAWFTLGSAYVFVEAKIKANKEKKKQEQVISSSAIFNNSDEGIKRR